MELLCESGLCLSHTPTPFNCILGPLIFLIYLLSPLFPEDSIFFSVILVLSVIDNFIVGYLSHAE